MRQQQPLSNAKSRLWLPPLSLAGCVRGVMLRDTTGVALGSEERFNHYPATPLCTVSWWLAGAGEVLEHGTPASLTSPRRAIAAPVTFSGPFTQPTITWNPGPAQGMMLLLMPDALHQMTGVNVDQWINRFVPAEEVLPLGWLQMARRVLDEPDDAARLDRIAHFLAAQWYDAARSLPAARRYGEWAEALALRAATTGTGRSLRQIERRIRAWTGQPLRELRGLGRAEQAFFAHLVAGPERPDWPHVAADAGYFDQSHLSRATRRITGWPPEELRRRIAEDEGFWPYRVWQ